MNSNNTSRLLIALLTVSVLSAGAEAAGPPENIPPRAGSGKRMIATGQILVMPKAGLPQDKFTEAIEHSGGKVKGKIPGLQVHIIEVPAQAEDAVVNALSHNPNVEFAEPDLILEPNAVANDTYFGSAWHLTKINATTAWDSVNGANVIVAVLDSGVNAAHPDLAGNMVAGWNTVSSNTDTADIYGHGTLTAGTVAAVTNNATGVASVAHGAKIMPIRITNDSSTGYATTSAMSAGITWAADHGARVVSLSYDGWGGSSTIQTAAQYLRNKGGVMFAAAGNNGSNPGYSNLSAIFGVSATDSNDARPTWSNYGNHVDFAAPGAGIYTTTRAGGYGAANGTSFSTPVAAGVAALVLSANPALISSQVEAVLQNTAVDIGDPGWDMYYGIGRLDAGAAVALEPNVAPDTTPPTASITAPANGAAVSGVVAVSVSATDNQGLTQVEFYAGTKLIGTDTTAPYSFSWDTAQSPATSLMAKAFDGSGNTGSGTSTVVMASTGPTVVINSPSAGATVSGSVNLSASATSNEYNIQSISISVDGKLKCSGTPSVSCAWDASTAKKGNHTVSATGTDSAGGKKTVSITVKK